MALTSEDFLPSKALMFEKLNGSYYRMFSFDIRQYLESLELFVCIDLTAEMPDEDANVKAAKVFQKHAKKPFM